MKVRNSTLIIGAVVLITASLATAADRCHESLAGTRSFTLRADVTGYRFAGERIVVEWARSPKCAGTAVWDYASMAHAKTSVSCQRPAAQRQVAAAHARLAAADASHIVRVVTAPSSADAPDRLVVLDRATNERVASWPLFERPARVALHGGIAILSDAKRHGIYALRISDGRIALLGVARAGDRPLIGPAGVLYQDDVDRTKQRTAPDERTLKLVPLSSVRRELARPFTTVRTYMANSHAGTVPTGLVWGAKETKAAAGASGSMRGGAAPPRPFSTREITSISMDGPRVAIAVRDPSGRCDRVLVWNVPWHYLTRLSDAYGQTCLPNHAPGGITDVAMAGGRAAWTATYGKVTRIIAATGTACTEWIVARSTTGAAGLAGDGPILGYALRSRTASVGIVPKHWRGVEIARSSGQVVSISVDSGRVAVLRDTGVVTLRTRGGTSVAAVRVGAARAIALRPGTLAVLSRRGTLDVYGTAAGRRLHSWRVPANAASLDLHYGIALVTAGRDVYAVNVETGRTARLMHAPARVSAELEGLGAVIQFNTAGRGHVRFVPMSRIEARIR